MQIYQMYAIIMQMYQINVDIAICFIFNQIEITIVKNIPCISELDI